MSVKNAITYTLNLSPRILTVPFKLHASSDMMGLSKGESFVKKRIPGVEDEPPHWRVAAMYYNYSIVPSGKKVSQSFSVDFMHGREKTLKVYHIHKSRLNSLCSSICQTSLSVLDEIAAATGKRYEAQTLRPCR